LRRAITLIGAGLVAAGLLAGCAVADSNYHYVKNSRKETYFKVPKNWTLYNDESRLIDISQPGLNRLERSRELRRSWRVGFDGDPKPTMNHLYHFSAAKPWGEATTMHLDFSESDGVSTSALRNFYLPVDDLVQQQAAKIISYDEFDQNDGVHGIHMVAKLVTDDNVRVTIDQTSMLSQDRSELYSLIVSCSSRCFRDQESRIKSVVDSWTVRAK
jgi:hypothetical protein